MPNRIKASLNRLLPVTWFRQNGCPFLSANARSSGLSRSFCGHAMLESLFAFSSGVISAPSARPSPRSLRATCSITRAKNSLATACATMKKNRRAKMLIFWSTSEAKAPLDARVWPMLKTASTATARRTSSTAPGVALAAACADCLALRRSLGSLRLFSAAIAADEVVRLPAVQMWVARRRAAARTAGRPATPPGGGGSD
mmetsp:Transcript_105449/g.264005  ORF Transcript_105449/g.264005 Transcript_105449/m.264005 type:complete len:200 (-) Transcript_105449:148-747(-)